MCGDDKPVQNRMGHSWGGGGGETALKDTCLQKKDNLLNDQGTGNNFKKFNQII